MKMTAIKVWCPQCKVEKHVEEILIVNGSVEFKLECDHTVKERFVMF